MKDRNECYRKNQRIDKSHLKNKKDEIRQKIIDYMNRGGEAK